MYLNMYQTQTKQHLRGINYNNFHSTFDKWVENSASGKNLIALVYSPKTVKLSKLSDVKSFQSFQLRWRPLVQHFTTLEEIDNPLELHIEPSAVFKTGTC
jgi:hypothetical protein